MRSKYGAIACGATSAMGKAQVRATLGPGTYHTVLKGMAAATRARTRSASATKGRS